MWYHGYDAHQEQEALDYELGWPGRSGACLYDCTDGPSATPERLIPLRWIATWIGALFAISLGLGLATQWLAGV